MSITCFAAWVLTLLLLPILFLAWATESDAERIRRLHRQGRSQRNIAAHMGISRHQVAKVLRAA